MKPWRYKLKNISKLPSFHFEGMDVRPLVTKDETEKLVTYHIRIPKKVRIPHSYHKIAHEIIVVLSGSGTAHLNDKRFSIKANDTIFIKPYTWHSFSTNQDSLEIITFLTPRVDQVTDLYYE